MYYSVNSVVLAAAAFTAVTTASPVVTPGQSSGSFWGGLTNSTMSHHDVLAHLENTGAFTWVAAPGGGFTATIEEHIWNQGVAGAASNATQRRSITDSSIQARGSTSTGLVDGLAGSINCYGSGATMSDSAISTFISQACEALTGLLVPPGGKIAAKGAYQLWKSGQTTETNNNLGFIQFGAKFLTSSWSAVDTTMCEDAYDVYSSYCQQKDSDSTMGGWLNLGNVIQFVADPTDDADGK